LERVGPLALSVDFELARLEWAAGVRIVLRPVDSDSSDGLGIGVAGWGGGGLLEREVGCTGPDRQRIGGTRVSVPETVDPIKLHGEIRSSYDQDALSCRISNPEGEQLHTSTTEAKLDGSATKWDLVIESSGDEATNAAMLARIQISRIQIEGAVLRSGEAQGEDVDPIEAALSGDVDALVQALRTRRETIVPEAQAALGRDYFWAYATAWLTVATMHADDEAVARSLLSDLDGLRALKPATDAERAVRQELLYFRGRARWRAGQAEAASADLLAVTREAPPTNGPDRPLRELFFNCHRLLAAIALAGGDEAKAIDHASQALASTRSREIGIDRLLLDPQLSPKRDVPSWEVVFGE
jgi:hypothetical protein